MKADLLVQLEALLEAELRTIRDAAAATYAAATHSESKAENRYDTRGLEASYLAGAQKDRVTELEATLASIKRTVPRTFATHDQIAATALVELKQNGEPAFTVFLLHAAAGYTLNSGQLTIKTVTTKAPLGRGLLGRMTGDTAIIEARDEPRCYEITKVY